MNKISDAFSNHLTNWGLVWFCLIFWGSIFNAILSSIAFSEPNLFLNYVGYLAGLLLGFYAKHKNWSWLG